MQENNNSVNVNYVLKRLIEYYRTIMEKTSASLLLERDQFQTPFR